jgi:protoporphyrinogen oxidase
MDTSHKFDLVIFGAGFTGLSSAYYYKKKFPKKKILIIEKENEVGGLCSLISFSKIKLEKFYHHWFERDIHIFTLINEIQKKSKIKKSLVSTGMYYSNTQYRFNSILDILKFKPLNLINRVRLLAFLFYSRVKQDWVALDKITAHEWLKSLCGKDIYKIVWQPLLKGKFGPHYKYITAAWIWKRIKDRAENKKNISATDEYFYYEGGFGSLAEDIKNFLKKKFKIKFLFDTKKVNIQKNKDNSYNIKFYHNSNNEIKTKQILFTIPNPEIYNISKKIFPKYFLKKLLSIKYLGNICLILMLKKSLSKEYWTNINDANFPFVGVIEHTNLVNKKNFLNCYVVYISKYVDMKSALFKMPHKKYLNYSLFFLKKIFPNFKHETIKKSFLHRAKYAQPLTYKNYIKKKIPYLSPQKNIYICNMTQIYPRDRSTNSAVEEGKNIINFLN